VTMKFRGQVIWLVPHVLQIFGREISEVVHLTLIYNKSV